MNQALSRKLIEVTADTLEKLAFVFSVPADTAPTMDDQGLTTVRVDFSGPFCGGMELSLPAAALTELAVNMLGAEEGEPLALEQQQDAFKELANVVCGNLLPELAGGVAEFFLRPPEMVPNESSAKDDSEATGYLLLESGACRVRLHVNRLPAQGTQDLFSAGGDL